MKHRITIYSVIHDCCNNIVFWTDDPKRIGVSGKEIFSPDTIFAASMSKNMVILLTAPPQYRDTSAPSPGYVPNYDTNCIDAYDYEGKHLWNIAEIIGDVGSSICYGHVCSTKWLTEGAKEGYIEGHELFVCWDCNEVRYLIDLDEKRVIHKMITR